MSNRSVKEIQDEAIRGLTGMLPMLDAADPSVRANIMAVIVFVVYYVKLQAS
jgi:hypothetical protein